MHMALYYTGYFMQSASDRLEIDLNYMELKVSRFERPPGRAYSLGS